jgi:hypothetical protein
MKAVLLLSLLGLVSCAGIFAQTPESELSAAEIYLAKDDGKGKPGEPATAFSTTDSPIHCVVKLGDTASVTVKMYLVAVNVSGVKPDSRVVSASFTTTDGQNEVFFNGRPHKVWFAGAYRADIFVDDKPFRSLDFVVMTPKAAAKTNGFAPKSAVAKPRRPRSKSKVN